MLLQSIRLAWKGGWSQLCFTILPQARALGPSCRQPLPSREKPGSVINAAAKCDRSSSAIGCHENESVSASISTGKVVAGLWRFRPPLSVFVSLEMFTMWGNCGHLGAESDFSGCQLNLCNACSPLAGVKILRHHERSYVCRWKLSRSDLDPFLFNFFRCSWIASNPILIVFSFFPSMCLHLWPRLDGLLWQFDFVCWIITRNQRITGLLRSPNCTKLDPQSNWFVVVIVKAQKFIVWLLCVYLATSATWTLQSKSAGPLWSVFSSSSVQRSLGFK